jgi:hypothetical protein
MLSLQISRIFLLVLILFGLGACSSQPKSLYRWGDYDDQVYAYLQKTSSLEQQIATLEKTLHTTTNPAHIPPGFYAHLGLLYGEVGRYADMQRALEMEKNLFPESAPFMDFLLKKFAQKKDQT